MSGHSKWANIKTIRLGGGSTNPEVNGALKVAIDKAREVNMPKENIQRLLDRFEERKANLVSVILEGYGPFGVPVIVEGETDNKNRILGEIKLIFKNYGGALGESNSVMYQFDRVGEVELENITEENQLELIDFGAIDFDENIVIVETLFFNDFVKKVEELGFKVIKSEIVYRAKNPTILQSEEQVEKIMDFIDELESNDDVLGVFCGFDYN